MHSHNNQQLGTWVPYKTSDIIAAFLSYLETAFTGNDLVILQQHQIFQQLLSYRDKYGDLVFSGIVDIVAECLKMPQRDLLSGFAQYYHQVIV